MTVLTLKMPCSRCPAVDEIEVTPAQAMDEEYLATLRYGIAMTITVAGKTETHELKHLCTNCRRIVDSHMDQTFKRMKTKSSSPRSKKDEDPVEVLIDEE